MEEYRRAKYIPHRIKNAIEYFNANGFKRKLKNEKYGIFDVWVGNKQFSFRADKGLLFGHPGVRGVRECIQYMLLEGI